jgi:type I restriction enzyme S subunit
LSKVGTVQTGLAKGKVANGEALELPYLRVANVQDGHLDLRVIKTVTVSAKDAPRFSLQPGDVLFTDGGDFDKLGRGTVWHGEIPNCLHQNHVFTVRPSPSKLLPEFLAALASSAHGRRYFQLSSKQSTNLASINSTQLKEFPVPLPPAARTAQDRRDPAHMGRGARKAHRAARGEAGSGHGPDATDHRSWQGVP